MTTTISTAPDRCKLALTYQNQVVVLIRHSVPEVNSDCPASEWTLSEEGVRRCETLARELSRFLPAVMFSSPETKAIETAQHIGLYLGIDFSVREDLREHRRPATFLPRTEFHDNIRRFFQSPDSVEYGSESCHDVAARIESEIRCALTDHPDRSILMVTHGTAMSSFIAHHADVDAFSIWDSLGLPAYIAFSVPSFDIVDCGGIDRGLFYKTYAGVEI